MLNEYLNTLQNGEMIKSYLSYLAKFGSERIIDYTNLLIDLFNDTQIDRSQRDIDVTYSLSDYYRNLEDERMIDFVKMMNKNCLWYTLYL